MGRGAQAGLAQQQSIGIKNLKRIVPNLMKWTREPNESYGNLKEMFDQVVGQFNRYNNHVAKYVGGIMETPKMIEQEGPVYVIVSKADQRRAVEYLNKHVFATPTWLLNKDIFSRTGDRGLTVTATLQDNIINRLISARTMGKLVDAEAEQGTAAYRVTDLLADVKKGIWTELSSASAIDVYRRQLQKAHIKALDAVLNPAPAPAAAAAATFRFGPVVDTDKSDIKAAVRAHMITLKSQINTAASTTQDAMTKAHLKEMVARIDKSLNPDS